jgi:hypothetical protein
VCHSGKRSYKRKAAEFRRKNNEIKGVKNQELHISHLMNITYDISNKSAKAPHALKFQTKRRRPNQRETR